MLAALISLCLVPVVARIFEPEHFGVAAVFLAIIATLGPLSTACFDMAIVLTKSESEASKLVKFSALVLIVFAVFVFMFLAVVYLWGVNVPLLEEIGVFSWLIPVVILLFGIINILENWLTRKKAYSSIAGSDVIQAAVMPVTRIGLGLYYGSSVTVLIFGYLIGTFSKIALIMKSILSNKELIIKNEKIEISKLIYEYRDFPLYSTPSRFLRSLSKSLPVLMMSYMFSPAIAGFYAMADRLVSMPTDSVAASVRRVYIQKASEYNNKNISLEKIFIKITLALFFIGVIPFGILWTNGEEIVGFILGDRWLYAGHFSEILAPWFFSIWLVTPSSALFVIYRKQKLWLNIQILLSFMRMGVFFLAYLMNLSSDQTLYGFVAISVLVNIGVVYIVYRLVLTNHSMRVNA